ncbi:MAG: amino acid adenylation domain-containing protein [Actinomycetota bacterium]
MTSTAPVTLSTGRQLAAAQRPLWLSQRLHPEAPVQNMALLTHIDGEVDPQRLADAFESTVDQLDALRTRIAEEDGKPVVHLNAERQPPEIQPIDRDKAATWAEARVATPLDTSVRGYDSVLLPHGDGTLSWYLCLHHTITDATSSALVFAATAANYHGEPLDHGSYYQWSDARRRELTVADPAAVTNGDEPSPALVRDRRALDHWAARSAAPVVDRLYRPLRQQTALADRVPVTLDAPLLASIEERLGAEYRMLSEDLGWTTLLMTATAAYLNQVAGASSFSLGLPVHNRSDAATRDLVGTVMEVFPVDISVEADDTFATLHKRVGRAILTTLGSARPGTAPAGDYAAVINVIPRAPVGGFGPLATSTRWIHAGAIDSAHLLRVQLSAYDDHAEGDTAAAGPALALDVNHGGAGLDHRRRTPGHFRRVMAAMVADPEAPVATSLLAEDELAAVIAWETADDFVGETEGLLPRLAASLPGRDTICLTDGDQTWTGERLWHQVLGTAAWLRQQGLEPGDRVGIQLPRSSDAVIAIMAVMAAEGSFVPLDVAQPARRLQSLTRRASCRIVLTTLPSVDELPAVDPTAAVRTVDPEAEAYLLFTSGSTGQPKGVPITHGGLARYLRFAVESYVEPGETPVVPLFSALSFDLTVTSLFLPFLTGGEQIIVRPDGAAGLAAVANEPRITWCKATPSHLEVLLRLLPEGHRLRTAVVGGEAFGSGLAKRMLAFNPDFAIYNEYGPTEAVVGCMIHRVDPERVDDHQEVPIGIPAPGVTLRVVGPGMERVPLGSAGELLISHVGVTEGYLNDPEAGELRDPFVTLADPDGTERRFYRSGDLVRLVDPHTMVYLGRIDEQVKVGGIRLEPTEVEDALAALPAIDGAAVRLWSPTNTEPERHCARCGLPSNVPGVSFDLDDVCNVCHDFDRVAPQTTSYFKTPEDLRAKQVEMRAKRTGRYDCLHLLSGGKDSTYALYQLVEAGFEPYALTLDNGFISEGALDNVRRSVADLGIDHEFATSETMNAVFRDSLDRFSNVCHGCYKTIYTLATNRAVELGIPMIVTGLSRGQLFETRLIPQQFTEGTFDPDAIDRAVVEARKTYHRIDDGFNRLLDNDVFADDELFERIEYLDFYRYVDVELAEMLAFLDDKAPWVRPSDTGRSTNCLINAAGISAHLTEQGYHNYAEPYAWDVRLGHKTRDEAIEELDDRLDPVEVRQMLDAVGYVPTPPEILTAWLEPAPGDVSMPSPAELRATLAEVLPAHAIPAAFVTVEGLPLTTNGKLDTAALPAPDRVHRSSTGITVAPETELEATIIGIWERLLRTEPIGADDDFFALGGDSLGALEMVAALENAIERPVGDELAFGHTTPRALAAAIEAADSLRAGADGADATEGAPVAEPSVPVPGEPTAWTTDDPPPLSPGERAILYEQSLRPTEPMYNIGRVYEIDGLIDPPALEAAIRRVAARHVPFSWSYGSPRRPLSTEEAVSAVIGAGTMSAGDFEERSADLHRRPFDLAGDDHLLRVWIQRLDDGSTAVLLVCHHVSSDAESFDRFWAQIDAELSGRPVEPGVDYSTFVAWQQEALSEADADHWRPAAEADRPHLRFDTPAPDSPDGFLARPASVKVADLGRRAGTTIFASAATALAATLRRYSEGDEVALAMVTSTRSDLAADPLVGYFLNALPLEVACSPSASLQTLSEDVTATVAGNLAHRTYPYARIVDDRRRAGIDPADPLVMVVFEELGTTTLGGLPVRQRILSPDSSVADATFWVQTQDDELHLGMEYRGTVLDQAQAERLLADFDAMLAALAADAAASIGAVELPSQSSSRLVGPELDAPETLLDRIEANATERGDQPAVVCGDRTLSWSELHRHSGDLAHRLLDTELGVEPGDLVAIMMPRTAELMVAIVGVLRAGAAYVPVDPSYPADRIAAIIGSAKAAVTITPAGVATPEGGGGRLTLDLDEPVAAPSGPRRSLPTPAGDDVAYVIFTSGSTGKPRGVPVNHRQLAASTVARATVYDRPVERFCLISSLAFDSSVAGLFWALADGGTIVLPTDRQAHDPDALIRLFDDAQVTHTLLVPTLYGALLDRAPNKARWPAQVIVAGEACPPSLVDRHFDERTFSALTNEYGPTECTVWATAHHCRAGDDPVPIGGPIPGTWVAVVDAEDNLRPAGAVGQLIIGGAGVVEGYLDDRRSTAERFGTGAHGRYFRTGDLAQIVDGTVRFLGRTDNQLNVGGMRAEPEDIERALAVEPTVGAVLVTAIDPRPVDELMNDIDPEQLRTFMRRTSASDDPAAELLALMRTAPGTTPSLVAFAEPNGSAPVYTDGMRTAASERLPGALRPSQIVVVDELPRTPNGKLDRAAVASLPVTPPPVVAIETGLTSRGSATDRMANLFAQVLRLGGPARPDQSFFDLGGHSLSAMELLSEVEASFGLDLTVSTLYDHPTPGQLAVLVDRHGDDLVQNTYLVSIQPEGDKPPLFGIHVLGINAEFYRPLAALLGPDQPVWGLGLPTRTPDTSGPTDVREVAGRYVEELERCVPTGPVSLAAVSLGSVVAFELARQLRERGREVALVALFDAAGPDAYRLGLTSAQRLRTHASELARQPSRYLNRVSDNVRDRAQRKLQVQSIKVRERLGLSVSDELKIRQFVEDNWTSQQAYDFAPYDGPMVIYKAGDDPFNLHMVKHGMGWADVATGPFKVTVVGGEHLSMLADPHVPELARELEADLASYATSTAGGSSSARTVPAGPTNLTEVEADIIRSVHRGSLGADIGRLLERRTALDGEAGALVDQVAAVTVDLARLARTTGARALTALGEAGIDTRVDPVSEHVGFAVARAAVTVDESRPHAAVAAELTEALTDAGFLSQPRAHDVSGATGLQSLSFITDDGACRLDVRWNGAAPLAGASAADGPTADGEADDGESDNLGLFLGTPTGMIEPLLRGVEPQPDELVVDLGCGDARVLVEAVQRFGCRGRGVETDPRLVARARERVAEAGLADRIEIVEGDATEVAVDDADIIFLFLPVEAAAGLSTGLIEQLKPGARLLAHEQLDVDWPVAPDRSSLVVADNVTVAHTWRR